MIRLIVLLFAIVCSSQIAKAQYFQGNYKYSDHGDIYKYQFKGDSALLIIHGRDTTHTTYHVDTASNPMQLDIQFYDSEGHAAYTSLCIFERVGRDNIRIRMSANLIDRPKGFLPKGNPDTILLVKEK